MACLQSGRAHCLQVQWPIGLWDTLVSIVCYSHEDVSTPGVASSWGVGVASFSDLAGAGSAC